MAILARHELDTAVPETARGHEGGLVCQATTWIQAMPHFDGYSFWRGPDSKLNVFRNLLREKMSRTAADKAGSRRRHGWKARAVQGEWGDDAAENRAHLS